MRRTRKKVDGFFFVWSVWSGNKFSLHLGLCFFNGKNVITELWYFTDLRCMGPEYHHLKTTLWTNSLCCTTWCAWFVEPILGFSRFKFDSENKKKESHKKGISQVQHLPCSICLIDVSLLSRIIFGMFTRFQLSILLHAIFSPVASRHTVYACLMESLHLHDDIVAALHTLVA